MKNSHSKFDILTKKLSYSHTDLACECPAEAENAKGAFFRDYSIGGYDVSELRVTSDEGERATGRPIGRYVTLFCPDMASTAHLQSESCSFAIGKLLRDFAEGEGFIITKETRLLIAGLGNRFITSDAIGPKTADKILATAHLNKASKSFASLGVPSVSVIMPGVSSQTGIEAADIIRGAAKASQADFIIAIDALASRSTERLCATVQISNSGIHPGSGIGNHRKPITKETMDTPVIAVGIPTVISSATIIYDALEKADIADLSPALTKILDNGKNFYVSHGESDTICDFASDILASAIEHAFMDGLFSTE